MTMKRVADETQTVWHRLQDGLNYDVGVDLGTANVLIYCKGKGLVLDEPAYVAKHIKTGRVLAVGSEAKQMLGRAPHDVEVISPLQGGVISDYDTTEFMLRYFIRTVVPIASLLRMRIVVCVPSGSTLVEKRAVLEALLRIGAKKTVLIEEPLAAALGTGLDQAEQVGTMVLDVGAGTTDIAVLCESGVVVSESLRIGGAQFDDSIIRYVRKKRKLVIGKATAESIKMTIGTVDRHGKEQNMEVRGRDTATGLPKAIQVSSLEVQRAVEGQMMIIIEGIKEILEKTPPELVAAIADHGIILTGGGVLIDGFDRVVTRAIGIAAYRVASPRYAVIKGVAKALREMSALRDTLEDLQ